MVAAVVLAAFGVTLVNFAREQSVDAQTALTFLVFLIAFGGLHLGGADLGAPGHSAPVRPGHRPDRPRVHRDLPAGPGQGRTADDGGC